MPTVKFLYRSKKEKANLTLKLFINWEKRPINVTAPTQIEVLTPYRLQTSINK